MRSFGSRLRRTGRRLLPGCLLATVATSALAAQAAPPLPERAVRRTIPITNAIRRALENGTRDSSGRPGRNYWQLRADYDITVRIDTATSELIGRERVTVHNGSPDTLPLIGLRLDPNHFIGTNPHAAPWVPAETTDGMVITRLRVDGQDASLNAPVGGPVTQSSTPAQPQLLGARSTSARVRLARPVVPRGRAVLEIEWRHKLPGGPGSGHRMTQRWADSLYQPTQWYPRIAMYDDLRGWDNELYLGPSEFYNPFGRFDVRIEAPAGWLVSATGLLQNPEAVLTPTARERLARVTQSDAVTTIVSADERGAGRSTQGSNTGWLTWHYVADTVNDFAWATARSFTWHATRATIPGKGPVPIHMFYLPGRANLFAQAGPITRHALEYYSRLWFPYPFPQLTLQDGPSAGMEYPMVINSNQGAADHEAAHMWWPMTVANNETWYGWMDEGFNQYMNILSAADARGAAPRLDGLGQSYGRTVGNDAEPPMMWNANYAGPQFYGFTTYSKTPLMLSALGGIVGDSAVQRAHREWAEAWRFKHPSPWDWMFFMNRALGRDLGWFWYGWLFTTSSVDARLERVTTAGIRTSVVVRQDGDMPSPVVLEVKFAPTGPPIRPMRNAVMTDSVTAVVTYPVDVWFRGAHTFTADLMFGGRPIERITFDPGCRFPDREPADNVWIRGQGTAGSAAAPCAGGAGR
jgi:hypothetical protein